MDNERYRYWREVQRTQLGLSANLYMVFASAILGLVTNFLITKKFKAGDWTIGLLSLGAFLILVSLFFYGWFVQNRLSDFQDTARWFKRGKTEREVGVLTRKNGEFTWTLYKRQRCLLVVGFIISLIGFSIYIYS